VNRNVARLDYSSALVTGGAGFIGSHICEHLVEQGVRVVCLDNLVAGKRENIAHLIDEPGFEFAETDVTDLDGLTRALDGVEVVFHNAASKNTVCRIDPKLDLEVNGWGAWCVAEASRLTGVRKIVHASTGSVYGEPVAHPQDESHPLAPRSFYGTSKLAGETYLRAFKAYYPEFRYSVVRYFHVYGPRQESGEYGGVIPIFIRRALQDQPLTIYGDGSQVRSFTYVTDDVDANILLANSSDADGEAFNAASGIRVTVKDLAEKILTLLDKESLPIQFDEWRPGDVKDFDVSNDKAAGVGAHFPTTFEEGLNQTIEWYRGYFRDVGLND
jgi:UDP-glucose 4-epimerase